MHKPLVVASGPTMVARMPRVYLGCCATVETYEVSWRSQPAAARAELPGENLKTESMSPGFVGPGLAWTRQQVPNWPHKESPYATLTDVKARGSRGCAAWPDCSGGEVRGGPVSKSA